jgi:hypothetical protein
MKALNVCIPYLFKQIIDTMDPSSGLSVFDTVGTVILGCESTQPLVNVYSVHLDLW